ncbi:MAG: class I SAM-dependent methyltransferase [Deltaproteobacteria bacterium]|nr:class I SAM-dependent methyltransferase [Deltaproteobacteria bacterium]
MKFSRHHLQKILNLVAAFFLFSSSIFATPISIPADLMKKNCTNVLDLAGRVWRQKIEIAKKSIRFRGVDSENVEAAYSAMTPKEFDLINGAQVWAERRLIPQAMNGRIPDGPALILDLGSGPASSTEIISFYSRPDWRIIGYDFAKPLVDRANKLSAEGAFKNFKGEIIRPEFVQQSITAPLRFSNRHIIPRNSVDFVNSSGVVGHHLDKGGLEVFAKSLWYVLKEDGYAAIDSGPVNKPEDIIMAMESAGFRYIESMNSYFIDFRPKLIFQKISSATILPQN